MFAMAIVLAATTTGVDYGWQTNDNGELEYIIQLEPALLEALLAGETIRSEIPPMVEGVRSFRIQVGRDPLPREEIPTTNDDEPGDVSRESPFRPVPPVIEAPSFPAPPRSFDLPGEEGEGESTLAPETGNGGLFSGISQEPPLTFEQPVRAEHLETLDDSTEGEDDSEQKEEQPGDERPETTPTNTAPSNRAGSGRPWFPLTLTAILLFASIGVNLYLFWILRETLSRYRRLFSERNVSAV